MLLILAMIRAQPLRPSPSEGPCEAKGGILPDRQSQSLRAPHELRRWGASLAASSKEIVMPKNKDLKRLTRSRMQKTGESYTTARSQLLKKSKSRERTAPAAESDFAALAEILVPSKGS